MCGYVRPDAREHLDNDVTRVPSDEMDDDNNNYNNKLHDICPNKSCIFGVWKWGWVFFPSFLFFVQDTHIKQHNMRTINQIK